MNPGPGDSQRTYRTALLQVVAYKKMQALVNGVLKDYGINTTQWIILGELFESHKGMRLTDLANILQVEVPLITIVTRPLIKQELIEVRSQTKDKRAKLLLLTDTAQTLVRQIESRLMTHMRKAMRPVAAEDMRIYLKVLHTITQEVEGP